MLVSDLLSGSNDLANVEQGLTTISFGAIGDAVLRIQEALVSVGFGLPEKGFDADFGAETGSAVIAFKTSRMPDPLLASFVSRVSPDINIEQQVIDEFGLGDVFCFPMSALVGPLAASVTGRVVEPFIQNDYCQLNGPCTPADFFDISPSPEPYVNFLRANNPVVNPIASRLVGITLRPDIVSHRVPISAEWYEIKPLSPAGVKAGFEKLALFRVSFPAFGFPYQPGVRYVPSNEIPMGNFASDAGENLDVFLQVTRPVPGLLFYRICVRGDYVRYFNRVRVIAGALAILVVLAPEALEAVEAAEVVAVVAPPSPDTVPAYGSTITKCDLCGACKRT